MRCVHGTCLGFSIMDRSESAAVPFNIFMTCFESPPAVIVYDASCQLATYALEREPALFANTTFVSDQLHFKSGHQHCSSAHNIATHSARLGRRNWVVCEQGHSKMRRISASVSYMTQSTFVFVMRHFLALQNASLTSRVVLQLE